MKFSPDLIVKCLDSLLCEIVVSRELKNFLLKVIIHNYLGNRKSYIFKAEPEDQIPKCAAQVSAGQPHE